MTTTPDWALTAALDIFLSDYPDDITPNDVIEAVGAGNPDVLVWAPFDSFVPLILVDMIEDAAASVAIAAKDMPFEEWLNIGFQNNWVGPPVCYIHDGLPASEEEESDDEPCLHILRLYDDQAHREAIEANHSPSQWRASNRGMKREDVE